MKGETGKGKLEIRIVPGDPEIRPASFSLFLQPFAYCLERTGGVKIEGPRWEELDTFTNAASEEQRERYEYFSVETSAVLFQRAKWFLLSPQPCSPRLESLTFKANFRDGRSFAVVLPTPRLVLFEWPLNARARPESKSSGRTSKKTPEALPDPLQTGVLLIELHFLDVKHEPSSLCPSLDNLLELNERFRFWRCPYPNHAGFTKRLLGELFIDLYAAFSKGRSYKPTIDEKIAGAKSEEQIYTLRWHSLLTAPLFLQDGARLSLFPSRLSGPSQQEWGDLRRETVYRAKERRYPEFFYADRRAFVWTCAQMDKGFTQLQEKFPKIGNTPGNFGHWVRLLNVDDPAASCQATDQVSMFERSWADEITYRRWEERGTIFGFSYHAGAVISPPDSEIGVWKNFRTIYLDIGILLFYLRLVLFRFSSQLNRLSAEARGKGGEPPELWRMRFQTLRRKFMHFTNLYRYPLISNQQQGIEMYAMMRQGMDVEELFVELQQQIQSSHEYLLQAEAHRQSVMTTWLTVVATVAIIFSLTLSYIDVEFLRNEHGIVKDYSVDASWPLVIFALMFFGAVIVLSLTSARFIAKYVDALFSKGRQRILGILAFITVVVVASPIGRDLLERLASAIIGLLGTVFSWLL